MNSIFLQVVFFRIISYIRILFRAVKNGRLRQRFFVTCGATSNVLLFGLYKTSWCGHLYEHEESSYHSALRQLQVSAHQEFNHFFSLQ